MPVTTDSVGAPVITHPLVSGVKQLKAIWQVSKNMKAISQMSKNMCIVWGISQEGTLFFSRSYHVNNWSVAGRVSSLKLLCISLAGWSYPVLLLKGVKLMSASITSDSNPTAVVFAHMDEGGIVQLTQDPVTTHWHQRSITLPTGHGRVPVVHHPCSAHERQWSASQ